MQAPLRIAHVPGLLLPMFKMSNPVDSATCAIDVVLKIASSPLVRLATFDPLSPNSQLLPPLTALLFRADASFGSPVVNSQECRSRRNPSEWARRISGLN